MARATRGRGSAGAIPVRLPALPPITGSTLPPLVQDTGSDAATWPGAARSNQRSDHARPCRLAVFYFALFAGAIVYGGSLVGFAIVLGGGMSNTSTVTEFAVWNFIATVTHIVAWTLAHLSFNIFGV